ncbi:hypothetical protein [Komagataeibacter intermedius]|nr:hypothetical protein [Komagataeibacter intermedius]
MRQTPEQLISAIEIYLVNFVSCLAERLSDLMEKRPHQPLKQQEAAGR